MCPAVSAVMPLYNNEDTINRAIQSVLAQTFQDFELIIVNDGSTDRSLAIAGLINDSRVHLVNQTNMGVSAARNKGIALARAHLIAFIDADDEWLPEYLTEIYVLVRKYPNAVMYASSYWIHYLNTNIKKRKSIVNGLPLSFESGIVLSYLEIASISEPPVWTSAVIVRKSALDAIGGFPLDINYGEDLLTWARLSTIGNLAFTLQPLAIYWQDIETKKYSKIYREDKILPNLISLCEKVDKENIPHLKRYINFWIYIRFVNLLYGNFKTSIYLEAIRSFNFWKTAKNVYLIIFLSIFPFNFGVKLHTKLKEFKLNSLIILNRSQQNILLVYKRKIRKFLSRFPILFIFFYRFKYKLKVVNQDTDLVIEGFPRSGNTYAVASFLIAQPEPTIIASHIHEPAQVIYAVKNNIPCIVIIRKPKDAIISLIIREKSISLKEAIKMYISYYTTLLPYKNRFVIAHFSQVISNFPEIIKSVNTKYSKSFKLPSNTPEENSKVFLIVESMENADNLGRGIRDKYISLPNNVKILEKNRICYEISSASYLEEAEVVYKKFLSDTSI